jgi:hypothetical protein
MVLQYLGYDTVIALHPYSMLYTDCQDAMEACALPYQNRMTESIAQLHDGLSGNEGSCTQQITVVPSDHRSPRPSYRLQK